MTERKLRYTLSGMAWIGALLCALGLLSSATVVASHTANTAHEAPNR